MTRMTAFTLTERLRSPETAWAELTEHPELLFGHGAPDLVPGRSYAAISLRGSGGSGTIDDVQPGRLEFTWGGADWPQPGRFVVFVGPELVIDARAIPDTDARAARQHWQHLLTAATNYLNSANPPEDTPVAAVLFDADGVLQVPRPGWLDDFVRLGGPNFLVDAFTAEVQCLAGQGDLRPLLAELLERSGTGGTVDEVLTVWHDIVVNDEALALVARLRRQGLIVGLATNQQSYRGTHMREVLGFDEHFDQAFYSYEMGHAKPSPAYFEHIAATLHVPPEQIAFVDDAPPNVVGARAAGLRAALHRTSTGAAGLADDLRSLGLFL